MVQYCKYKFNVIYNIFIIWNIKSTNKKKIIFEINKNIIIFKNAPYEQRDKDKIVASCIGKPNREGWKDGNLKRSDILNLSELTVGVYMSIYHVFMIIKVIFRKLSKNKIDLKLEMLNDVSNGSEESNYWEYIKWGTNC